MLVLLRSLSNKVGTEENLDGLGLWVGMSQAEAQQLTNTNNWAAKCWFIFSMIVQSRTSLVIWNLIKVINLHLLNEFSVKYH